MRLIITAITVKRAVWLLLFVLLLASPVAAQDRLDPYGLVAFVAWYEPEPPESNWWPSQVYNADERDVIVSVVLRLPTIHAGYLWVEDPECGPTSRPLKTARTTRT